MPRHDQAYFFIACPHRKWKGFLSPRFAGLTFFLAVHMLWAERGWADPWQHVVTSSISAEYETNPAMSPASQGSIRRAVFAPGYTLARTDGANEWRAGLTLQVARSSNTALSLNREDPGVFFSWHRQGDAGGFGISARYDEAATRATEAGVSGPVAVDGTRTSRTLSATWSKPLSERGTLAADGAYTDISYDGGTYVDYATRSGGLKLTYDWSESVAPFLNLTYSDQTPSGGGLSGHRTGSMLGLNLKISERLDGTVQAGNSMGGGASSSSQYGVTAQYAGQRNRLALNANRQTSPSGLGNFVTSDQMNGDWSHELSERSRAGINLGWRKNRSVTDETNRTMGAWVQRDLDASWAARAHYQRRVREGSGIGASSNLIGISLNYNRSSF
ncbi:MAG: hypothetical protein HZC43_06820 [Nitrosomonadales bacterium]|nr:hypothetical protein [Nitrosomonadales bacterium]